MISKMKAEIQLGFDGGGYPVTQEMSLYSIRVITDDGKWITLNLDDEDNVININGSHGIAINPKASNSIRLKIGK